MKGKTTSGFSFDVEDVKLDDFELLEDLVLVDEGHPGKVVSVLKRLLGNEQYQNLKEHVRKDDGVVHSTDMGVALKEIFEALKAKNS